MSGIEFPCYHVIAGGGGGQAKKERKKNPGYATVVLMF